MACFHLIRAWQTVSGDIVFVERGNIYRALWLPCGQCIGCRLERSRQWMIRALHESKCHDSNAFLTLTFDEEHYPYRGMLDYSYYQNFMRRLRNEIYPHKARFYMCGEYGKQLVNPHFHALIFGYDFPDKRYWKKGKGDSKLYRSEILEKLWPFGFSLIGAVTPATAGYVAGYCTKKITGDLAETHYRRLDPETGEVYQLPPEFNQMSRKPGIGYQWLLKYRSDYYNVQSGHSSVVIDGREQKAPRYYDKAFEKLDALGFEAVQYDRYMKSRLVPASELSDERLAIREEVAKAKTTFFENRS